MSSRQMILILLVVIGGTVSCSKAKPVFLPTTNLQAKMAGNKSSESLDNQSTQGTPENRQDVVVAKETPVNGQDVVVAKETPVNGQDATGLALKCRTSGGIPLEFCVEGVQVDCVKGAKGEFCTQYVSESDGQM